MHSTNVREACRYVFHDEFMFIVTVTVYRLQGIRKLELGIMDQDK